MFNFLVWQSGEFFGRDEVHCVLERDDVCYVVMFGHAGIVYATALNKESN